MGMKHFKISKSRKNHNIIQIKKNVSLHVFFISKMLVFY